ncbi:MAG: hypothetical protein ACWGMY_09870, partial [Hyphomicrobiaceae bacterium]
MLEFHDDVAAVVPVDAVVTSDTDGAGAGAAACCEPPENRLPKKLPIPESGLPEEVDAPGAGAADGAMAAVYTYDADGNRIGKVTPLQSLVGVYEVEDRLIRYGSLEYTYDS